jgi:hypothetical protein
MQPATRADLDNAPSGAFLYCPDCGAQYSATPGDYWYLAPEDTFPCDHGGLATDYRPTVEMILATRRVEIRPVTR